MLQHKNKLLAVLLSALLVSLYGCGSAEVDMLKAQAEFVCKEKGGVLIRWTDAVKCNNGEVYDHTSIKIHKDE